MNDWLRTVSTVLMCAIIVLFAVSCAKPSKNITANGEALDLIRRLVDVSKPKDRAELERVFGRKFYDVDQFAGGCDYSTSKLEADNNSAVKITQFNQDNQQGLLELTVNLDRTYLSETEVVSATASLGPPERGEQVSMGSDSPSTKQLALLFKTKSGNIECIFTPAGQLWGIRRDWFSDDAARARALGLTPAPPPPSNAALEAELNEGKRLIEGKNFRVACRKLLSTWDNWSGPDAKHSYEFMCRKRNLVRECYVGMKRSDVCEFLDQAPIEVIRQYLILKQHDIDISFPSGDIYRHRLWIVSESNASLAKRAGSNYSILMPNLGRIEVFGSSPRYLKFYALLGPLKREDKKQISPLPRDLVDAELFKLPN